MSAIEKVVEMLRHEAESLKACHTLGDDWCGDPVEADYHEMIAAADAAIAERDELRAKIEALQAEVDEWKRVAAAQAELHGEAEERADKLAAVLRLALDSHGVLLMTDPMQDAWKVHRVEEIGRALLRDLK